MSATVDLNQLRPRQWADAIALIPTLEMRRQALDLVPAQWRGLVETHLEIRWQWKLFNKQKNRTSTHAAD